MTLITKLLCLSDYDYKYCHGRSHLNLVLEIYLLPWNVISSANKSGMFCQTALSLVILTVNILCKSHESNTGNIWQIPHRNSFIYGNRPSQHSCLLIPVVMALFRMVGRSLGIGYILHALNANSFKDLNFTNVKSHRLTIIWSNTTKDTTHLSS